MFFTFLVFVLIVGGIHVGLRYLPAGQIQEETSVIGKLSYSSGDKLFHKVITLGHRSFLVEPLLYQAVDFGSQLELHWQTFKVGPWEFKSRLLKIQPISKVI